MNPELIIEQKINAAIKNKIILNHKYLDDEQLSIDEQSDVLKSIFDKEIRDKEINDILNHFTPIFTGGHPISLSVVGKTGVGKSVSI